MTEPLFHLRHAHRRRRWLVSGVGLLVVLLAGLAGYAHDMAAPHPERFAAGVSTSGPAWEALRQTPLARAFLRDFQTQQSGSSCGPASLRNVLVSLGHPVADERALFRDDRRGWLRLRLLGMTLDELAVLAARSGVGRVQVHRDLSPAAWRDLLGALDRPGRRLIVNFDRAAIHGVALGHFSPLGGYDPVSDRVLLLDVTPGYGVQLVPSPLLLAAMQTLDPVSGRRRGLLQIDAASDAPVHNRTPAE